MHGALESRSRIERVVFVDVLSFVVPEKKGAFEVVLLLVLFHSLVLFH